MGAQLSPGRQHQRLGRAQRPAQLRVRQQQLRLALVKQGQFDHRIGPCKMNGAGIAFAEQTQLQPAQPAEPLLGAQCLESGGYGFARRAQIQALAQGLSFELIRRRIGNRQRRQNLGDLPVIAQTGHTHDLSQPCAGRGDIKLGPIECRLYAENGITLEHKVCGRIELMVGDIDDDGIECRRGRRRAALTHRQNLAGRNIFEVSLINLCGQRDDLIGYIQPGSLQLAARDALT